MRNAELYADAIASGEPLTALDVFETHTAKACEELGRFIAAHHFGSDLAPIYVETKRQNLATVAASFARLRESRIMREAGFNLATARRMMTAEVDRLDKLADRRLAGEATEAEHTETLALLRYAREELNCIIRCLVWLNGG